MAQIITPEAIISYPKLFKAEAYEEGDTPEYSAALIFPEGTDLKELKVAAITALKEKWGEKTQALLKAGKINSPFRTDVEEKGYPEGSTFFNVRSRRKPGVVSIYPDENGKPSIITDEDAIVAGARVKVALSVFTYDVKGNKGVSFGLNHVQLIRKPTEEERLDGRVAVEDSFAADLEAVADLSDLEGVGSDDAPAASGGDDLSDLM